MSGFTVSATAEVEAAASATLAGKIGGRFDTEPPSTPTPTPTPATWSLNMPSVLDYGAKGDGLTDDSAAFAKALAASYAGAGLILVPPATYMIKNTVSFTTNRHQGQPWGLIGFGSTLLSGLPAGADMIDLIAGQGWDCRYFRMTGLSLSGSGKDGNGFKMYAPSGINTSFYNNTFDDCVFQNFGGDGCVLDGNIFETSFESCFFEQNVNGLDCLHDYTAANGGSVGVCSSISLSNCFFIKNSNYGLNCAQVGAQYGGATDIEVRGGYFRGNGNYGAYYNNGMSRAMTSVGFEENCTGLPTNSPTGAHVYAGVGASMMDCSGWVNAGGCTYLLSLYAMGKSRLTNCRQTVENPNPALVSNAGILLLSGTAAGNVLLDNSAGNVTPAAGNAAKWSAIN